MAATTPRRFFNIDECLHGTVEINTVQSITLRRGYTRLMGQGDADITDSFQAKTNLQVGGTIVLQDPIQADALLDSASATLSWKGLTSNGGTAKQMTVTGVEFFGYDETDSHNALDNISLTWNAFSPTGIDPVTAGVAA